MLAVAIVRVTVSGRHACLAHDDHAGRAAVDAEPAPGAHVLVDDEDDVVVGVDAGLLGVDRLTVRERWQGVYATAPEPFLVAAPIPDVRVVSVTSGIGMTTALGSASSITRAVTNCPGQSASSGFEKIALQ